MSRPHIWVRAEQRANESRVGITPVGVQELLDAGFQVSVEASGSRIIETAAYVATGCNIVAEHSWPSAPEDAIIFGLKELPEDGTPLRHRHIMFGHAFKGQGAGQILLRRFRAGGGTLLDLEYLTDETGRRVAAFGYWAGFAGAAVTLKCWAAQKSGTVCKPLSPYKTADILKADVLAGLKAAKVEKPSALIIGAKGRVGSGAADLNKAMQIETTGWDVQETAHGGPYPEILEHDIFLNCILAGPKTPAFVPISALKAPRTLCAIGDIACDPDSSYNPVPVYDRATSWSAPALRVHDTPPLDVMAIDNLPSLLPLESSEDFAGQLLPVLRDLEKDEHGIWSRAEATFNTLLAQTS